MTPRNRLLILAAAVVVLVVAFVVAQGSGDDGGGSDASATQAQTAPAEAGAPTVTTDGDPAATETGEGTAPAPTTTAAPKPSIPVVRVVDGEPKGGVRRLSFEKGDKIRFRVVSDVADEIHVHGYDQHFDVEAGGSVTVALDATIEGRFEVELEDRGTQIVELEVTP